MTRAPLRFRRPGPGALSAGLLFAGLLGLAPAHAQAQVSFNVTPSVGSTDYQVQLDSSRSLSGDGRHITLDGDVGLPNGFFLGLSHTAVRGGELDFNLDGRPLPERLGWRRADTAFTVSHAVTDDLNVFMGLRNGSTRIDTGIGTEFRTSGYFVGFALPVPLGPGYLSLSAAVGVNKGTWRDDLTGDSTDQAFGYSLGARFSWPVAKGIAAGAGVKAQRYDYTLENVGLGDVNEKLRLLELFVSFSF